MELDTAKAACKKTGIKIYVVAHSQGTMIFYLSQRFTSNAALSKVEYEGFGGQKYVSPGGMSSASNIRAANDPVPGSVSVLMPWKIIPKRHADGHDFNKNYIDYVQPIGGM